jgi:arabinose-5-phosphate isomerase
MVERMKERAIKTLTIEAEAVSEQIKNLDDNFYRSVEIIAGCHGRIVVMGLGKSGLIGRKIAATMSSVGLPAVFLHPAECLHGDIGMVMRNDAIIMLSYSGETDEIKKVMPVIKRMGVKVIVMTGRPSASAWRQADNIINCKVQKEACPYNLAPTASTTAMLAMGDALALCASEKKDFKKEQFATFHPSGGIGKKLTLRVIDIMHGGKTNPVVTEDSSVKEALLVMTTTRLGATSVIDASGKLTGFFTDGDLRRRLQEDDRLLQRKMSEVMTRTPLTISTDTMAVEAATILREHNFDNIPVVNEQGKPVGIVDERDLLTEGILDK